MKRLSSAALIVLFLLSLTACQRQESYGDTQPTASAQTIATAETTVPTVPTAQPTEPVVLPEPEDGAFVRILDYIPTAVQELRYATEDNFTGQPIYDFCEAYLRYGTVKKLMQVSEVLAQEGLYLKIWDGFRPVSAQFALWEVCPDPTYVANPEKGHSSHSRGNTIDLTLVDENGQELEMPTGFDDFSAKANRDYSDCTEMEAANARLLEETMEAYGFSGYYGEWWHFSDTQSYPVEEVFRPNAG